MRIERDAIPAYAASLPLDAAAIGPDPQAHVTQGNREEVSAFWLTLNAINFGSGWFPTLRKRPGHSGYLTVATALRERFSEHGPWSAAELARLTPAEIADVVGQAPEHELMRLFARSLNDLGERLVERHHGEFVLVVDEAEGSAVALVEELRTWDCFSDISSYRGLRIPFLKRAQIATADLGRSHVAEFRDIERLTIFADNVVPHVLRLDGVLTFEPRLVEKIGRSELIEHQSGEEVEIRACALHAVELIVAARSGSCAAEIDQFLWLRGRAPRYKAVPRHRARCTAY